MRRKTKAKITNKSRKKAKVIPFDFVLEALHPLEPITKSMFGCTAIYVGEKIVLILRDRPDETEDNGVWLATSADHHESLRRDFPIMRSIGVLANGGPTGWQVLPSEAAEFETLVLKACDSILAGDVRIGKIPQSRRSKTRAKK